MQSLSVSGLPLRLSASWWCSAGVIPIRNLRSSKGGAACTDQSNCRPGHSSYGGIQSRGGVSAGVIPIRSLRSSKGGAACNRPE